MKTYVKSDFTKAYRISDGAEVSIPKAWLDKGSPYADGFTRTNPTDAATKKDDAPKGQQGGGTPTS